MIRANVGVSRKMSKDYNSTGFSLNLDAEIHATLDDPEAVVERIKELYDLAEEALDRQISESQGDDSFAHRGNGYPANAHAATSASNGHDHGNGNGNGNGNGKSANAEPASNKQVQFLTTLGKRRKLFAAKLEEFIEETIGRRCSPYDLTKKEAGRVIDALNPEGNGNDRFRR